MLSSNTPEQFISSLFNIKNRVAIVTGAAGQMGGEYVRTFLNAGCRVAALDINPDNPKGRLAEIKSDRLLCLKADITNRNSVKNCLDSIVSNFGVPSVLVNNAAIDAPPNATEEETGPFESYPESSLQKTFDVNLKGMILCCQIIGGCMAENQGGSIINISSLYGVRSPDQRIYEYKEKPFFKPVSYSITKGGVIILTRYLATYWAKKNVRVNTLVLAGVFNNQDETFLKNYIQKVPMGRMANQDDFNGAIIYLASDASRFVTGAEIVIDGGYSCW